MACGCSGSGSNEINTLTCNGDAPCSSSINTSSHSCGCGTCQCGQSQTAVPTPYYNSAMAVQESHCQTVVQQQYVTALTTSSSFNVPVCDGNATITVPGLTKIQPGSYLWNPIYGYFEIVSFDYVAQQVVIKNKCVTNCVTGGVDFASAGTLVPACTMFSVVDPPCSGELDNQFGVFVAIDFLAPAIGNCIDILVNSIAGLYAGLYVQILSGTYRVSAIINATTITICNDANGITPGTLVVAEDNNGNYIAPVTPYSANACQNAQQTLGALLTCHNNIQAPLGGQAVGQVPVLVDKDTGEVQFQTLDLPTANCTTLASCLNLVSGTVSYVAVVADSSIFIPGDVLIIHDPLTETYRWSIDSPGGIIDPTHIAITKTTPQTVNESVGCDGAPICLAPCCEQLATGNQICDYDWSGAFKTQTETAAQDLVTTPVGVGESRDSPGTSITITNDTCNTMQVIINANFYIVGSININPGGWMYYTLTPMFDVEEDAIGGPAVPTPVAVIALPDQPVAVDSDTGLTDPYEMLFSKNFMHSYTYSLPTNRQLKISSIARFTYNAVNAGILGTATENVSITHLSTIVNAMGVAVQGA